MQNIESIIKNLRVALGFKQEEVIIEEVKLEDEVVEKVEVKFIDVKSGDMTLRVDGELVIGASVAEVTMDEAGAEILNPVEDGEYPVEGGQTLVIANSTITDIIQSAQPEVEAQPVEIEVVAEATENFSKLEEFSSIITSAFEKQNSEIAAMKVTIDELYRELAEVKKQPATVSIKMSKSEKARHDINVEKNSHMDELVKLFKNK